MRIGSLARSRTRFGAGFVTATIILVLPLASFGQVHFAHYDPAGPAAYDAQQAYYSAPANCPSPYVDANGNTMVVPAGYCEACNQGGCQGYGGGYGGCGGRCGAAHR